MNVKSKFMFLKNFNPSSVSSSVKGALLAILSALLLSTSMSMTKTLSPEIPTSLVVFMRTFFGLLFFLPFLIKNRRQFLKTTQPFVHLLRIMTSVLAMLCTYYLSPFTFRVCNLIRDDRTSFYNLNRHFLFKRIC